jgi:DnaJ-class molecular chaperone
MPVMKRDSDQRGDAYVELSVELPQTLTEEQQAMVEKLRDSGL